MEFIYKKIKLFRENIVEKGCVGQWINVMMLNWLGVWQKKSILLILIKEFMKSKDF